MQAAPAYANQACQVIVEAFEGRLFFSPTPENKRLLSFLLAHYALKYKIDLHLVVMMGDKVALHFLDRRGLCLEALRAGETGIIWPSGTNYHHFVNGFPRLTVNPPPIPP